MATATATRGATVAAQGLNTALRFSPVGAMISVVTGLASAYLLLNNNISKAKDRQLELNLAEQEYQFRKDDFKKQKRQAEALINLQKNPLLIEDNPDLIRQKIQQAQMMRDFFKEESLTARQLQEVDKKTGYSVLQKAEERLKKEGGLVVEPSSELARLLGLKDRTFIQTRQTITQDPETGEKVTDLTNIITDRLDQIRKENPVLADRSVATSFKSDILANSLQGFIDFFKDKLPEDSEDPLKGTLPDTGDSNPADLADAVNDDLRGSAVGGVRNVTVNMNIGDIINSVHAENALEGVDEILDQVSERLIRVMNEAGLQAKVILSR